MGGSIGQSVFRVFKDTFSKPSASAPSTGSKGPAAAPPPAARWQETAGSLLEGLVKSGFVPGLYACEMEGLEKKIKDDMEAFVRDNPKASPERLDDEAKKVTMRRATMARVDKQREKKIKERLEELRSDRWG